MVKKQTMPRRILVVDDEPDLVTVVRVRLAANGYDVMTASDGLDALEKLEREKPDLILLDIMMPHMDGFEVLRILKNNPETSSIPVVMLTAKPDAGSISKAEELGAADYLIKPFNSEALLDAVKKNLL